MKKTAVLLMAFFMAITLMGCEEKIPINIEKITLSPEEETISLKFNESVDLKYEYAPDAVDDAFVVWSSSDETVAMVDQNGKVTALAKEGSAVITVKAARGEASDSVTVTVKPELISSINILPEDENISIPQNGTLSLSCSCTPEDADEKEVIWSSSDESIATVDQTGKVTALAKTGTVTIKAKAVKGTAEDSIAVTVRERIPVTGIVILPEFYGTCIPNGESLQLSYRLEPENADPVDVVWSSDDPELLSVDQNGLATAAKDIKGEVQIRVKTEDGSVSNYNKFLIEPSVPVESFDVSDPVYSSFEGYRIRLKYFLERVPENSNGSVIYTCDRPDLLDINHKTTWAKLLAPGIVIVTATSAADPTITASMKVFIGHDWEEAVPAEPFRMFAGDRIGWDDLFSKITTAELGDAEITGFSIDDSATSSYIETDAEGRTLLAKKAHSGLGLVVKLSNGLDGLLPALVVDSPFTLNTSSMKSGETITLVKDAGAADREYEFISDNPAAVSVTAEGVLTAHTAGNASITVVNKATNCEACRFSITVTK